MLAGEVVGPRARSSYSKHVINDCINGGKNDTPTFRAKLRSSISRDLFLVLLSANARRQSSSVIGFGGGISLSGV